MSRICNPCLSYLNKIFPIFINPIRDLTRKQNAYQFIHTQSLGNSSLKNLIAKNEYDKLGQLITKEVGGSAANASDRWQEINYNYNIRGWLTRINDIGLVMAGRGLPPPSPSDDLFSFAIQYNQLIEPGSGDYTSPLYNGNIAQTFWKTASDNTLRGYNYEYDQLNRLLNAEFYKKGTNPYSGAYNEALAYDVNGNIKNLIRTTADANNNPINMDELTYSYQSGNGNSNRLMNVNDAVSNQNTGGFKDGNTNPALNDYEYDQNGNMTKDRNKGIESITYNHLNLPTIITWSNEKYISYQYNAAGQKISKSVRENDSIKIVEYLDGFQYAGEVLQFFPHPEGYVKVTAISAGRGLPTSDFAFNYVFNYTDHLGNVRLSYTKDPQTGTLEILDEDHYYPFGLRHGVYATGGQKGFRLDETGTNGGIGGIGDVELINILKTDYNYKYNGKELQDELGLDWYDYGARNYDATIGRWMNVDPLAEQMRRHSPYNYAFNNPVFFIDPDGMMPGPGDLFKSAQEAATDFGITYNGRSIIQYREYGSTIYKVDKDGETYYTYTEAAEGSNDGVTPSKNPENTEAVAFVHSHGGYEEEYDNNNFSGDGTLEEGGDKGYSNYYKIDGYVTTPNGSVKEYKFESNEVNVINTDKVPSDPNDPDRQNNIHPTQDPMIQESINKINDAGGVI
jgi:RHS repeat-associated protein